MGFFDMFKNSPSSDTDKIWFFREKVEKLIQLHT
jgi:hypothetical protein